VPISDNLKNDFQRLIPKLREIETYYFEPRYGVDTSGRISLDEYNETDVKEIYSSALEYLELCFTFIENNYGKQIPRNINELKQFFKANYIGFVTR
jgi:HEPN domain-containing protein